MNTYDEREPSDDAHAVAQDIIEDLLDRKGIGEGFDDIDLSIRMEIVDSLADIIRLRFLVMGE